MKKLTVGLLLLALLSLWLLWGNTALQVNTWIIESEEIPSSFDGFRIAQVSDLHNAGFWEEVVAALAEAEPDIIVLTGDLIDSGKTDVEAALSFAEQAVAIAPCYAVTGNHEAWSGDAWDVLRTGLLREGVVLLEDEAVFLDQDGETVALLGLSDPAFGSDQAALLRERTAGEGYTILLSHRPELISYYEETPFDLVLCGHAHGGQVIVPSLINGLYAPHQGLFPKYAGGEYIMANGGKMIVSRGLSRLVRPRVFNRPELVLVTLLPLGEER